MVNINNEFYKLEKILADKKNEVDISNKEYKAIKETYTKKLYELEKTKEKYEALKQKNSNLKLMILNLMKLKNITKDQ